MALDGFKHIAERPTDPIGQPANQGATYYNTSNNYDCAVAGLPFFLGIDKEHPYKRETAQYRKQQIDQQKEPGEQTLTGWWLRSQSSFHYGAGIRYEEPVEGETVGYRFNKSAGVDVFNIGRVTLLPDVAKNTSITVSSGVTPIMVGGTDANGVDLYLTATGSTLHLTTTSGTTSITWGGSGTILALAQDGANYYVLNATGIYKGPLTNATSGSLIFTNPSFLGTVTNGVLGWVKQRLIAGINGGLFEVDSITSYNVSQTYVDGSFNAYITTSQPNNFVVGSEVTLSGVGTPYNGTATVTSVLSQTQFTFFLNTAATSTNASASGTVALANNNQLPIYVHPNPSWKWTAICEGPNNIYVSGYAGSYSSIFRLALDTTTGSIPLLTRSLEAALMPTGEQINCMGAYLGKFIVLGTNKGIRIGTIDTSGFVSNGYITYGPLIVITNGYDPASATVLNGLACRSLVFNDRYAYVTISNYIDNGDGTYSSGLIKIDLSRDFGTLQMGWATHLRVPSTAEAVAVCVMGQTNKLVIGVKGVGVYQQSINLVSSGYLQTGQIRYFTLEDKHFELVKLRETLPIQGKIKLSSVLSTGLITDIITVDNTFDFTQDITGLDQTTDITPQESIALKFTFYSASGQQVGSEDSFNGYQLKALPAVARERIYTMPLLCYDFEEDRYNMVTGYDGRAMERLTALESVESNGDVIILQDFTNGETIRGVIESISFSREAPPDRRFNGFGGVISLQFRTIVA